MKNLLYSIALLLISNYSLSQNAKQVMADYAKATGGEKNWNQIHSMTVKGTAKLISQGGMELPFTRIMKKDGKQITSLIVNGMDYVSIAYDGKTVWGSNQQMQPEEKSADETKNTKLLKYDFPYPGHNWKKNDYKVEYLDTITIDKKLTHKIKLTKLPQWVDGEKVENILYIYIDVKEKVPVLTESEVMTGPSKGQIMKSFLTNYKDVNGYLFPFTVTMKYGDKTFQILESTSVEWNAEINDSIFSMPSKN